MAWNEPGGGKNDDPWGGRRGGQDDGPPDLDEALRKLQNQLGGIFGGGSGGSGGARAGLNPLPVIIALVVAVLVWVLAGFYQLDEQERGVIFRFGAAQEEVQQPGLRWRPWGIDQLFPVNTTRVNSVEHQALMLTEDQNIVNVSLSVQYVINDPIAYVVNVRSPEESLKQATESALRHEVGGSSMDDVISNNRQAMALAIRDRIQSYMNDYGTGILVNTVNLDRGEPPSQVQSAFDDVQRAQEDEQRFENEANAYAQQVVPEARGDAARILEQANAYRDQVIARATGEADRFSALLTEYQRAERVTRDRLYLDAVEEVLASTSKVLMDVESGNQMVYLPLDRLGSGAAAGAAGGPTVVSPDTARSIADAVVREIESRASSSGTTSRRGR